MGKVHLTTRDTPWAAAQGRGRRQEGADRRRAVQARPEIVAPPLFVKLARKTYLNHRQEVCHTTNPELPCWLITHENGRDEDAPSNPNRMQGVVSAGVGPQAQDCLASASQAASALATAS